MRTTLSLKIPKRSVTPLIAVLLLIFLIYKRLSLIPATLICVAVLALTNGFSYMDLFINHYGVSLAGFVGKYFLVFVTNALYLLQIFLLCLLYR